MAADYGAAASDVAARLPYLTIDSNSSPSSTQVLAWIEEGEAMLNNALKRGQITTPVTDSEAVEQLKKLSIDYAEARTRMAYAAAGGDGDNDDGKDLLAEFNEVIAEIRKDPTGYSAELGGGTAEDATRRMRGHVLDDVDGRTSDDNDFKPTFDRGDGANQF